MRRAACSLIAALLLAALVAAAPAGGQSEGTLRDHIGSGKAQERSLASAAARLGRLERKAAREVAVLEGRLDAAQADLDAADARLATTQAAPREARRRVTRLRERLAEVRGKLGGLLRERYMGDRPDFVTVVLHADGFPQLLETLTFVRRVERADTRVLGPRPRRPRRRRYASAKARPPSPSAASARPTPSAPAATRSRASPRACASAAT